MAWHRANGCAETFDVVMLYARSGQVYPGTNYARAEVPPRGTIYSVSMSRDDDELAKKIRSNRL